MPDRTGGSAPKKLEGWKPERVNLRGLFTELSKATVKVAVGGATGNRVALAKFLLYPANLYLLDEPSNRLDPLARGVLEEALTRFEGTILMASHDQSLLETVATGIFEVEGGKLIMVKDPAAARD